MTKKIIRGLFFSLLIFSVSVFAGYLAFRITYHYQTTNVDDPPRTDVVSAAVQGSSATAPTPTWDHFLACLEQDTIAIYAVSQNKRSFLYSFPVRISALSEGDRLHLESGVVLPDQLALAAFKEDFSS